MTTKGISRLIGIILMAFWASCMVDAVFAMLTPIPIEGVAESPAQHDEEEAPSDVELGMDNNIAFQTSYSESTIMTAGPFLYASAPTPILLLGLILLRAPAWLCRFLESKSS